MKPFLQAMMAAAFVFLGNIATAGDTVELKVLSFNIWYGGEQVSFEQVLKVIRAADADIVALQEPDGNTLRIAAGAGYAYADVRRHIISRFPLFDSGLGEITEPGVQPYSVTGLDSNALHVWAMVSPGRVVAVGNTHLTSSPSGPDVLRATGSVEAALRTEREKRVPEAQRLAAGFGRLARAGVPLFLAGDFNSPSHLDWTAATAGSRPGVSQPVAWPVTQTMMQAGLTDSFRSVHPDPVRDPGITYTPGYPHPMVKADEIVDRIDYIWTANASVLKSEIVGEAGNPAVSLGFSPWPSDHRALLSTFRVVPMTAPALIAVEPRPVVQGQTLILRASMPGRADWSGVIVPRGGDPGRDAIAGIDRIGFWERPSIKLSSRELAPGRYDAVLLDTARQELARTRFSVVARDAVPLVAVVKPSYAPGEPIGVRWQAAPGSRFDWLGVYRRGDPNVYGYLGFVTTGARHEGEVSIEPSMLTEALTPGDYEVRLLHDDSYVVLAGVPFTIRAPDVVRKQ